jgi:hypothetical protein
VSAFTLAPGPGTLSAGPAIRRCGFPEFLSRCVTTGALGHVSWPPVPGNGSAGLYYGDTGGAGMDLLRGVLACRVPELVWST